MGKLAMYKFAYFLLIVFTFLLTVISVMGSFAGNVHPRNNLIFCYISLALPVLLIICLVMLFYWSIRRKIWFLFPLIAIVANYGYLSAIMQFTLGDGVSPKGNILKIMTLNARNFIDDNLDDSANDIKEFLEDESINIVCFQEYRDYVDGRPERISKFFESDFPYQAITDNVATFSKFPIRKRDYLTFRESNNRAQWVDVEVGRNLTVRVINVHMQTTGMNSALHQAAKMEEKGMPVNATLRTEMVTDRMGHEYIRRAEQADIIADIVKETRMPMILCGDFNDTPASYTYKKLKGRLNDGFKTAGEGYMYTYRGIKGFMRIDYILHSESLEGVNYYSPERNWSDHNPVIMEMNLPE